MRFDEVWMSNKQLEVLAGLTDSTNKLPGHAVEIGVHQGLSTFSIAKAASPDCLHAVDHWQGSVDMPAEVRARDNYQIFLDNRKESGLTNIFVHKIPWRDFAVIWSGNLRFVHLDAGHTVDEVSDQIKWATSSIVKGGIIAGDDYGWSEVQIGVHTQFPRERVNLFMNKLWWVIM